MTKNKNLHMTHAEDLVMLGGVTGINWVLKVFSDLYEKLKGFTLKEELSLSVKIDGAPAIFAWSEFPGLENYGIAMKGLFAKSPKVMYSDDDIDAMYPGRIQLTYKLKSLLKHIKNIDIPAGEIWQGDFLFDNKSLFQTEIDGEECYAFHPNTIYYVVPKSHELAKKIESAEVGIVWHTIYLGEDLNSAQANYNADVSRLKNIPEVFMTDPYIKSLSGIINFSEE
ncbi:MAG: hypothetical protein HC831_20615, partial [Chloroflexia bacterium]|nr:hypothetical protein [Chloroflexia bacterium]